MENKTHRLAAIVFTDIVGYTRQMESNELRTMQLLQRQREIVFPVVKEYGGEVIKELGDGLLMMFGSAIEAVRFAIEVQQKLKDEELTIRAGIHIGDVIFGEGDVFGSAVNIAARLQPLAPPNGICVSNSVMIQIRNKEDIRMASLGKKELKGVDEPVEVFSVLIGDEHPETAVKRSFLQDVWNRRIVHILGGYLIATILIRLGFSSLAERFMLSPNLVQLVWVILLSMIPTVFILSYYHAKIPGKGWTKFEKVGVSVNFIFTITLAILIFRGKDLGATTTSVTIENENGEKVERVLMKKEFRKKIIFFFPDNESSDTSLKWMQYAIPILLEYDLSQDIYFEAHSAVRFVDKMNEAGYPDGLGMPFTLKRKICSDYLYDYFTQGSFRFSNGTLTVNLQMYESQTGQKISENEFTDKDIFTIADPMTLKIKTDLGIPENRIASTRDLAVAEIFTGSEKALKNYTLGFNAAEFQNELDKGIYYTELACKDDPAFTAAYLNLAKYYFNNNQPDKSMQSLEITQNSLYKLPEVQQYFAKFFYYLLKQQPDKAMAVLKMWAELYPDDIKAHTMLAERYQMANQNDMAIKEYKTILSLDPGQYVYVRAVGDLYEQTGNFDSAEIYYRQYAEKYPQDYISYKNLGELYIKMGEFEKAKQSFDKALLIETGNIPILLSLSMIDLYKGNADIAIRNTEEALQECKSARDSTRVYSQLSELYEAKGQVHISISYFEKTSEEFKKYLAPKDVVVNKVFNINKYVAAGEREKALQILKEGGNSLKPPLDKVIAFGYLFYFLEANEVDSAEKYIADALAVIEGFGEQKLMGNIYYAKGIIFENRGDYQQALDNYENLKKIAPNSPFSPQRISACYRELGKYREAEQSLAPLLKQNPFNPKTNYEAAMLHLKAGDRSKAKEYLTKTLDFWKEADSIYEPAQKAREAMNELQPI